MRKRNQQIEEAVIREHFERFKPQEVDLWPEIRKRISTETERPRDLRRRRPAVLILCGALMLTFLLGMAFHRFFVYHAHGTRTWIENKEGTYIDSEGMKYSYADEPFTIGEIWFDYDWPDRQELPEPDNPYYLFLTDYDAFSEQVGENSLGIRLPKLSAIPRAYSERPFFRASYYLTPEDLKKGIDPDDLPENVQSQIGRYQLYWFKENKELFSVSCMPVEDLESIVGMFILSDDATISYHPIEIQGVEKAFAVTYYNKAFKENGTDLILCQEIEPTELYDTAYEGTSYAGKTMTVRYIRYQVQTVGISEEETIRAV